MKFYKLCLYFLFSNALISCTSTGDIYSGKDGEKFDVANTAALAIGAALLYEASKYGSGGGGGYTTSYRGTSLDDDDWDYLPSSNEYRCRSRSTGQFVYDYLCADDILEDSWY
jgi:hypothetical protein